ncbi:MAG: ABC transporter ATP-binding protein [Pseudobacter sp.]|uniref:ABC transporter ATP-binding protein n=1 Tax=Pseudobacter sp. TaxID=2045420 RepID=UPI003F7D13F8
MSIHLKVEHLSHRYATAWAIHDINFEISTTGIVGLLGSNGAGKSTTMNIICGVLKQTEGDVFINGLNLKENPLQAKRQIGFLPQTAPLHLESTVEEYLSLAAHLRFIDKMKVKQAVAEAMDKTGITHFRSRLIRNLSGGYKQRVGIAQAIIHKPSIVVLDEPTNGLDPNQIIEARRLIQQIGQEHIVLLSSHVLTEINLLCRDVVMIENGRIVFTDSMDAFNNYVQPTSLMAVMENPPASTELLAIEGVAKVEFLTAKKCRIYFSNRSNIAETIIAASIARGWRLQEINLERSLLDDVFKELSVRP